MSASTGESETAWKAMEPEMGPDSYRQWLSSRRHMSIYCAAAYVLFIFAGRAFMRNKQPPSLSRAFLVWNLILTLFSLAGLVGVLPEFYNSLKNDGFFASYCRITDTYYSGMNGYWVYLFHLSKVLELGDTVFLVLRKRPVIFLHWYHHVTVLVYLWFTYHSNAGPTRWGVVMNYFVHCVMYAYYAAKSARIRCPGWLAPTITSTQMFQFVLGGFFCAHSLVLVWRDPSGCDTAFMPALVSAVLYFSYLVLFAKFFYHSYLDKSPAGKTSTRKKSD